MPPLSELQAITDMVEFRKKAKDLNMVVGVCKPDVRRRAHRNTADILEEYTRKLDVSRAASATSEPAAKFSSAFVSEAPQEMTQGSTHDFVSVGSVSSPSALSAWMPVAASKLQRSSRLCPPR